MKRFLHGHCLFHRCRREGLRHCAGVGFAFLSLPALGLFLFKKFPVLPAPAGRAVVWAEAGILLVLGLVLGYAIGRRCRRPPEVLQALPLPVLEVDGDLRILRANQAACRLLGRGERSLCSLNLEVLTLRCGHLRQKLRRRKNRPLRLSLMLRPGDEKCMPVELLLSRGRSARGECFVLYLWDRRWARRREEVLKKKWQDAERVSRARSLFVSLVSHEFRTPMASTQTMAELLRNHAGRFRPEEIRDYLEQISHNIFQMSRMMDDILLLGQIQNGQLRFGAARVDPLTLCRDAIRSVRIYGGPSRVQVVVAEDFPPSCSIDPSLFRYILSNLLSNALKYSPPESRVTLVLRRDRDCLVLEVADRGIGILPGDHGRIFHLFHRGANVGPVRGIGVGMFMVKYCVDLHRGSIAFQSTPGAGTTFRVKLPDALREDPEESER